MFRIPRQLLLGREHDRQDPHAWTNRDALAIAKYILRRHSDGWRLVRGVSRVGVGDDVLEPGQARIWGSKVVRLRGKHRVIDWLPVPGSDPMFTPLRGLAAPLRVTVDHVERWRAASQAVCRTVTNWSLMRTQIVE